MSDSRAPFAFLFSDAPDAQYADDLVAARHYGAGRLPRLLLAVLVLLMLSAAGWAAVATVEEVTRGEGRVIPSSKIQTVQSLEGGIVKEILVRQGSRVARDQVLLRIDDTGLAASMGEIAARRHALRAQIARLTAEAQGAADPIFTADLSAAAPGVVAAEREAFALRRQQRDAQVQILAERRAQKQLELAELTTGAARIRSSLGLAQQELNLNAPLARQGVVPRADFLRLQREVNDLKGELEAAEQQIPRAAAALREAEQLEKEAVLKERGEAQAALATAESELAVIEETLRGAADRVARTEIRSPVEGIVNTVNVTTIGGVVQPGAPLVEIVPLDDALLVEARIRPADIAFIGPGQRAVVKLTAYDFAIYGGLEGEVERIGADALVDPKTGESYYTITVRTRQSALTGPGGAPLPIIPGMVASVDIITGEKTVLGYLLKPIIKTQQEALKER